MKNKDIDEIFFLFKLYNSWLFEKKKSLNKVAHDLDHGLDPVHDARAGARHSLYGMAVKTY